MVLKWFRRIIIRACGQYDEQFHRQVDADIIHVHMVFICPNVISYLFEHLEDRYFKIYHWNTITAFICRIVNHHVKIMLGFTIFHRNRPLDFSICIKYFHRLEFIITSSRLQGHLQIARLSN